MKNVDVLNALQICVGMVDDKVPFRAAMAIRRIYREASAIAGDIEAERKKLVEQYAKEQDGDVVFKDEAAFVAAYEELLNTEVETSVKIKSSAFKGMDIEPRMLIGFGDFLED